MEWCDWLLAGSLCLAVVAPQLELWLFRRRIAARPPADLDPEGGV